MQLEDGTGNGGYKVKVDNENRAHVFAVTEPEDKHSNREGHVWSLQFSVTPAGAGDYFFYLENTGTVTLAITDIRVSSSVVTELNYDHVSGTPTYVTGTDVSVTSRLLGNTNTPTMSCKYDTDITGLSSSGTLFFEECANANQRYKLSTSSNIMIPQGQAVAFRRTEATGLINCIVSLVDLSS